MKQEHGASKSEARASEILEKHFDRARSKADSASSPDVKLLEHFRAVKERHLIVRQWVKFLLKPIVMLGSVAVVTTVLFLSTNKPEAQTSILDTVALARENREAVQIPSQKGVEVSTHDAVQRDSIAALPPQTVNAVPRSRQQDTQRIGRESEVETIETSHRRSPTKRVLRDSTATVGQ